jgi:hypothetical protein
VKLINATFVPLSRRLSIREAAWRIAVLSDTSSGFAAGLLAQFAKSNEQRTKSKVQVNTTMSGTKQTAVISYPLDI